MSTQIRGAQIRELFAGDGLDWVAASGTGRNYLAVQVDDSSIEISGDALQVKADGIDNTHIAWGSTANQVDAVDIPMQVGGGETWDGAATNVQDALEELEANHDADFKFKTIAVSGQDNVVADTVTDTLTFVAGTDITITTNSGTDAITINAIDTASDLTASLGVERVGDDFRSDLLSTGGLELTGNELGLKSTVPGDGLTMTAGVLNVIGGNGITANTDDIELSSTVPGTGLTMTAGVINVIGGDGITANADEIEATVDDSTIELSASDGSGALRVKDSGIPEVKLTIDNGPQPGYYLRCTTASGLEWADVDVLGVMESDLKFETEVANGSTTIFDLTDTPVTNSLQVYLNGLIQQEGSGKDYTYAADQITFAIAPETDDILLIHYTAAA